MESPPDSPSKAPPDLSVGAESLLQTPAAAGDFNRLIEYLKQTRGFDFSGYKVSSLMRRIQKRMREAGIESYSEYIDFLEVHPDEFGSLFDTILINVTEFFRDPEAWDFLAKEVVPQVLADRGPERSIRVWSAGCASGEEAYSLAILLAEAMGEEGFRQRAKIYATDADEGALATARQGIYEASRLANLPPGLVPKYFETLGDRYVFRAELRRSLIFGRHDLIQDAAISRLDLLLCRNTLMYFNSETQDRILARFHFALNTPGYLFLGKAETLLAHGDNFRPVDLRHRVFARAPTINLRNRLLAMTPGGAEQQWSNRRMRLHDYAYDASPVAQLAVDRRGLLVLANDRARRLFGLGANDLGRLLQDLEISYRPVELRSHIDRAYTKRSLVLIPDVQWHPPGEEDRYFEIQILPLTDPKGGILGASISFLDQTRSRQLQVELERAHQELETAYEELQSSNEELETTNEELQSTVEELETTNEELQSANEELETMNEELQSTNDELRIINDQIQLHAQDLDRVSTYFESVLTSLRAAVVVVDRNLQIQVWSDKAQDLWGLRADEATGRDFLALDIGLPVALLTETLREGLTGRVTSQENVLDGFNRLGKPVRFAVSCTTLRRGDEIHGIVLLVEETNGMEASTL